jgi:hypothetical protein
MNDVRPLAYLLTRSIFNGVKRAVTSPKRLIALTFFALYYYQILLRPFSSSHTPALPHGAPQVNLPGSNMVDAIVFGLVGVLSILLMTSVLSYKGGFKAADVDVLFPTPVSPRVVLLFRIARDTLVTLLVPLLLVLIGFRNAGTSVQQLVHNYPSQGGDIMRAFFLAYLMVAMVWVCIGYAASLFVNRSDLKSDRNRKIINVLMGSVVFGIVLYIAISFRMSPTVDTLVAAAHAPVIRILLAPVTLATWAVMGTFDGNPEFALGGVIGLAALIAIALRVAMTQVGWMYDQAAVRGFDSGPNMRDLQRRGDIIGMQAERARQGKLKHGRIASRLSRLQVSGAPALLWKEAVLQARGSLSGLVAIGLVFLGFTGLFVWTTANKHETSGWVIMGAQAMMVYMLSMMSAQSGFIELLRRVDLQKPLPFTPSVTVFWEVLAKAIAPSILGLLSAVVGLCLAPWAWAHAIAGILITPTLAILLASVVLLVVVLFPDFEDPTQRMFRGLMLLLGIVLAIIPGTALFLLMAVTFHLSPLLIALPVMAINVGLSIGMSVLSGNFYASYNPSE